MSARNSALSLGDVLGEVVPAVQKLRQQGKVGFCGITALGETTALHRAIDAGAIDTAQVCYNLLNPSAAVAVPSVDPIATAPDYRTDVARAQLLGALVREGHAANLIEASLRLAIGSEAVSTVLVGYSSLEHLEAAAAAVNRGPLPRAALDHLASLWSSLAGR